MEAPYVGVIAGGSFGVESLAIATKTEGINLESIQVMLNLLGWTREAISARDSIMLRIVHSTQCHSRLKCKREVVVAVMAICNRLGSEAVDLGVGVHRLS
ncbi:hypothetical protein TIFTF001_016412 [Ficus carica]|uniref:Uncharacterized protein n=1 Tax=Ficus carica TaxID=3494 RepID=A0AA88D8R3_FICCA|nr:hypothetical protein TIFTF001_016412 [Ficus carica]